MDAHTATSSTKEEKDHETGDCSYWSKKHYWPTASIKTQIPGPFVVLQGTAGDGLVNTVWLPQDSDSNNLAISSSLFEYEQNFCQETRKYAANQRQEWIQSTRSNQQILAASCEPHDNISNVYNKNLIHTNDDDDKWIYCPIKHELLVWDQIPPIMDNGAGANTLSDTVQPIGTIAPGATIIASSIITRIHSNQKKRYHFLQIQSFNNICRQGYIVMAVNHYFYCVPGVVEDYFSSSCNHKQLWRVMCHAGAIVRQGTCLSSSPIITLPFGTIVQVHDLQIQMGLTRLLVSVVVVVVDDDDDDGDDDRTTFTGWCSELLNPLSGQCGVILQPMSFAVPVQVRLLDTATVTSHLEESSRQTGRLKTGTTVSIVQRVFSAHGVERLLLSTGGWISMMRRGNKNEQEAICQQTGIDSSFDPHRASLYHWQTLMLQRNPEHDYEVVAMPRHDSHSVLISPVESSDEESNDAATTTTTGAVPKSLLQTNPKFTKQQEQQCLICLTRTRTATLVHGETGHIVCCLPCGRILKARDIACPVCRLPIDSVIQHFWA